MKKLGIILLFLCTQISWGMENPFSLGQLHDWHEDDFYTPDLSHLFPSNNLDLSPDHFLHKIDLGIEFEPSVIKPEPVEEVLSSNIVSALEAIKQLPVHSVERKLDSLSSSTSSSEPSPVRRSSRSPKPKFLPEETNTEESFTLQEYSRLPGNYRCKDCYKVFSYSWGLKEHRNHACPQLPEAQIRSFKCTIYGCAYAFKRKSDLNRHISKANHATRRKNHTKNAMPYENPKTRWLIRFKQESKTDN